jgi:hypothetical protein
VQFISGLDRVGGSGPSAAIPHPWGCGSSPGPC